MLKILFSCFRIYTIIFRGFPRSPWGTGCTHPSCTRSMASASKQNNAPWSPSRSAERLSSGSSPQTWMPRTASSPQGSYCSPVPGSSPYPAPRSDWYKIPRGDCRSHPLSSALPGRPQGSCFCFPYNIPLFVPRYKKLLIVTDLPAHADETFADSARKTNVICGAACFTFAPVT